MSPFLSLNYQLGIHFFMCGVFFFFFWYLELNSGPRACEVGAVMLSYTPGPSFFKQYTQHSRNSILICPFSSLFSIITNWCWLWLHILYIFPWINLQMLLYLFLYNLKKNFNKHFYTDNDPLIWVLL